MVAVIAALGTDTWWLLPVAFLVFIGAAVLTLLPLGKALDQGEKPDPVTDARLESKGADSGLGLQDSDEPDETGRDRSA